MDLTEANRLSQHAREASKLCNLWLDFPAVAQDAHEAAAAAQEQVGNQALASEHRRASKYWAARKAFADLLRGHSLVELLATVAVIAILASFLAAPVGKAYRRAKVVCWAVQTYHNARLEVFMGENDRQIEYWSTNRPVWVDAR